MNDTAQDSQPTDNIQLNEQSNMEGGSKEVDDPPSPKPEMEEEEEGTGGSGLNFEFSDQRLTLSMEEQQEREQDSNSVGFVTLSPLHTDTHAPLTQGTWTEGVYHCGVCLFVCVLAIWGGGGGGGTGIFLPVQIMML